MPSIFQSRHFTDTDSAGTELDSCLFFDCSFDHYQMGAAHLSESSFVQCKFANVSFYWMLMYRAKFMKCVFTEIDFRGANMTEVIFSECRFERCDFSEDKLGGKTDLSVADFLGSEEVDCSYNQNETGA